jgi:filamentous hemagglutinin family protein
MGARGALGEAGGRFLGALRPPLACASLLLAGAAGAQVVLDGSLGPAGPVPFDGTTWDLTDDLGAWSGNNLFHSLSELGVPAGLTASLHLLDPSSAEPDFVIVRVTGGHSPIDGRIQSLHQGAGLFLLNPAGFSFGPQSAVQALGSVYLSSADVLRFGGDEPFDARSDATPTLLSADPPTAFGFLSDAPAPIVFDLDAQDTGFDSLPVPRGATFAVVGGDIRIDGWSASPGSVPTIRIEGGSVELAAVGAAGVDVPVDIASFDARAQAPGALGEVALGRNALLDVGSPLGAPVGAGRVVVRSGRLVVDDARIDVVAGSGIAGNPIAIDLEAAEGVEIWAGSRLTVASAAAPAGDLRIAAESVEVTGAGTRLTATASGAGEAPDVLLDADAVHLGDAALVLLRTTQPAGNTGGRFAVEPENPLVDGTAVVLVDGAARVLNRSQGAATGGAIAFDVAELRVEDAGSLQSESLGTGGGGTIDVAAGTLVVGSGGQLLSRADAAGAGGAIGIDADLVTVTGPSEIRSSITGSGPGGAIDVAVGDLRLDTQGQIVSENTGSGAGGAIDVSAAREVSLTSRGKILSQASGAASNAGGDATVDAGVRILVVGEDSTDADVSQISALTSSSSPGGSGGSLRVSAPTIELRDAGQLRTTTTGAGQGGALDVVDTDLLLVVGNATVDGELAGAGLFARTSASDAPGVDAGDGGDLTIVARVVQVEDGGEVSARTLADGDAGDLVITGAERVTVRGGPRGVSTLSSRGAQGAGGDLVIDADRVELASGGLVSASTVGTGDAGDISVSADTVSISGAPSGLFSQTTFPTADSGAAGDIDVVVAQSLEVRDGGRISVDSGGGGAAGDVVITGGPGATVALVGGNVSARSRRSAEAGNVTIKTGGDFVAGRGAVVETQAEGNASGGRVAISADGIFYASDALIATRVDSGGGGGALGDGGNVGIPPPPVPGTAETLPVFAVLNRSSIIATAIDGNGGNIRVAANDLVASQGVVVDATSRRGVPGEVEITTPDEALAGQITPLPSNFLDASKLMTTACDARRARTGSFVVQTRAAALPLPDAPLAPSDLDAERAEGPDEVNCPG